MNHQRSGITIETREDLQIARFHAMACTCEILIDSEQTALARDLAELAAAEAWRIERKFSRYRNDNIVAEINAAEGQAVRVDEETARLLNYAENCYRLSDGLFDITSGVLRQVWRFDGSDRIPEASAVAAVMQKVGWQHVEWQAPAIRLQPGMEIDLGGIGKEYAVDRSLDLLAAASQTPVLVNYGGDLRATPRDGGRQWRVGVDTPNAPGTASRVVVLQQGALATSGDANRYLFKDGIRYSHLLDPRNGWPVRNAPRSVTVAARLCVEAGMLSSLAMLMGADAEHFLEQQGVRFWCERE